MVKTDQGSIFVRTLSAKSILWLVLSLVLANSGCRRFTSNTGQAAVPPQPTASPFIPLPTANLGGFGDIRLHQDSPTTPKCDLMPLPEGTNHRRFLAFDLNTDGTPEYFVENSAGAHSLCFVLVDSQGKLLTRKSDINNIGGDRLLILNSRHHGYFDLVDSDCDSATIIGQKWQFDGKCYAPSPMFTYPNVPNSKAFIEDLPGKVKARWYCDPWSIPPRDLPNLLHARS